MSLLVFIIFLYSFFVANLFPFIPYDKNEIFDSFIKKDKTIKTRSSILTKNIIRGRYK